MLVNGLGSRAKSRDSHQLFQAGFADFPHGLEMLQQQAAAGRADAGDAFQGEAGLAFFVQFAAILAGKTVRLILDGCQQAQQDQSAAGKRPSSPSSSVSAG